MSRLMMRRRRSGFSPLSLGPAIWFKADAISGIADGAAVATWNDSSGNARNAAQAAATKQPLFRASGINGKPAVDFDGTNDVLTTVAYPNGSTVTVFAVAQMDTTKSWAHIVLHLGPNTTWVAPYARWAVRGQGTGFFGWVGDDVNKVQGGSITVGAPFVIELSYDGSLVQLRYNGAVTGPTGSLAYTGAIPSNNASVLLGGALDTQSFMDGRIAEVVVYEQTLTADQSAVVRRHLANKYAITVS